MEVIGILVFIGMLGLFLLVALQPDAPSDLDDPGREDRDPRKQQVQKYFLGLHRFHPQAYFLHGKLVLTGIKRSICVYHVTNLSTDKQYLLFICGTGVKMRLYRLDDTDFDGMPGAATLIHKGVPLRLAVHGSPRFDSFRFLDFPNSGHAEIYEYVGPDRSIKLVFLRRRDQDVWQVYLAANLLK